VFYYLVLSIPKNILFFLGILIMDRVYRLNIGLCVCRILFYTLCAIVKATQGLTVCIAHLDPLCAYAPKASLLLSERSDQIAIDD